MSPMTPSAQDGGLVKAQPAEAPAPPVTAEVAAGRTAIPPLTLRAIITLFDALIVALAFLGATAIVTPSMADIQSLTKQLPIVCGLTILGLSVQGAYEFKKIRNGHQVLTRLCLGAVVGLGLLALASYALAEIQISRSVFTVHGVLVVALLLFWRRFLFHTLREAALRPCAVVLGDTTIARKVAKALSNARFCGAQVVGILTPRDGRQEPGRDGDTDDAIRRLGAYERLGEVVRRHDVSQAIVVAGPHDERLPVADLVALRQRGLSIEDGSAAYEAVTGKLLVEKLTPGWLVFANAFEHSRLETVTRRVLGILIAGAALAVLSPFLLIVAVLIKLDSRGPVFFKQERVGEGGKTFMLFKFRTMGQDAEKDSGPVWAKAGDPRVTRLGRILRSTRIDELPQLWNVLNGEMYFVGPRPERPHFVDLLRREVSHYDQRHTVKPGITGWAQINYRYGESIEDAVEKLHFDLFYIQNMSTLLDLYIVLGTVRVMLGATNKN